MKSLISDMGANMLTPLTRLATRVGSCLASLLVAATAMLPLAQPAQAAIGSPDVVPAATLLLPYFEVDLANENGAQTTMRVTNTSATAVLVNVTLWTDLGVPTYAFPIYLVGYDTEEIDLRLLFKGILPITASDGQDPSDKISPQGNYSQDINFASCTGILPLSLIPQATVTALRNAHTGQSSTLLGGSCGGVSHGDNLARGFVTMDLVNQCGGPVFPSDAGYFVSGGSGRATTQNTLTGTVSYLNRSQNLAYGESLVHIEANPTNPLVSTAGSNTFYGRFNGFTAADNREVWSSTSQARFMNGGAFSGGTDLIVWRDPGVVVTPFACGPLPAPFPLTQTQIVAFDEEENPTDVTGNRFPYVTQKVAVSTLTSNQFGFLRLNLTRGVGDAAITGRHQSAISARYTAAGAYGGSLLVPEVTNASRPANENYVLPIGGN
jgi:hypothetical protein